MRRSLVTAVMIALAVFVMSSGLAVAKKAPPPFTYAFVDTDGDGVYTEGVDLPAVVNKHDAADGSWIEITVPDSLVGSTAAASGAASPALVFPAKTHLKDGDGALWISSPGTVNIGPGVQMRAGSSISISAPGLVVGAGAAFITSASGDVMLDIGDGGVRLDGARFDTSDLTIYVGIDYGNGLNGALVAENVTIETQTMTLGTREGISLTDSTVHFKKSNADWDPQAALTTNFDSWGAQGSPYPVDLSRTTFAGPGKNYYSVDVYGSPVITAGMKMKGTYDMYIAP